VESPYKFNENVQNSLMASTRGHPIWMDVMHDIANAANHGWCKSRKGTFDVLASAGPTRLEKWVQHPKYVACTNLLQAENYYNGQDVHTSQAFHHNMNSWVPQSKRKSILSRVCFPPLCMRRAACGCQHEDCWTHGRLCGSE
jgi:hypothetical protein